MPREIGSVNSSRECCLVIRFENGETQECILDTGFNGALFLPRGLVEQLGLPILGREAVGWVNESEEDMDISLARIEWLGADREVEVIVGEGDDALIGTELLEGARVLLDFVAGTISIETS
jgi:clan AA aspartic protease